MSFLTLARRLIEGDRMRCRRSKVRASVFFGLGLLVASVLPTKWVLAVAAAALVFVSISCIRR